MKIVIAQTRQFHALSRKQVEKIFSVLPKDFATPIQEFIIQEDIRCHEPFEYYRPGKRVNFSMLVEEKTDLTTKKAAIALLIGIARIRERSEFFRPLSRVERDSYKKFVEEWLDQVIRAATE
jgi:hypothetical protein